MCSARRTSNRVHFAKELLRCRYVSSIDEAFRTVLDEEQGLYLPSPRVEGFKVIDLLHRIGAVPVLAHPFLNLTVSELREFLPEAKVHGLVGMETHYSTFSAEETVVADLLAEGHGLLPSGGSDFHGTTKPKIRLGIGHGTLAVPFAFCEALAQA